MNDIVSVDQIGRLIHTIRGIRVMLDSDLAWLYGVSTKVFNQAIKRNDERFPDDFVFRLTNQEVIDLRSQIVTSKKGRGGRRYLPLAFTEHGCIMLANILRSPKAVDASIQVVRSFVKLREMIISHKELSLKLEGLERRYDHNFKIVFDAIRELMKPVEKPKRKIGFRG